MSGKDLRLPYDVCKKMSVKKIRQTKEYASLTPGGVKNSSGHYRYGNKSTMNKEELCKSLDNPKAYHAKIAADIKKGKNSGPRKRSTRKGDCPVHRNKKECVAPHANKGLTTTGKPCCYKKKQSEAVLARRRKAKALRLKKMAAKKSSKKKSKPKKASMPKKSKRKSTRKSTRKSSTKK